MVKHVVMFSGGVGSWAAGVRVAEKHGTDNLTLLFTDTLLEDTDLYRFLIEGAADVLGIPAPAHLVAAAKALPEFHVDEQGRVEALKVLRAETAQAIPQLVWLAEGRDPWTVFFDRRFLGNSRVGLCSQTLKREPADRWMIETCDPASTVAYLGIDWTEDHRYKHTAAVRAKEGWRYEAPLCEAPWTMKGDLYQELRARGIRRPRLYGLGMEHNNCGGGCVKGGQGHWANVLRQLPAVYAWWEAKEQAIRVYLESDVAMMRHSSGPKDGEPLTLLELRTHLQRGGQVDMFDVGGCGCFLPDQAA